MGLKQALKRQYHAALAMLREALELCPADLWKSGPYAVPFWRVAYHTLYFTHLYIQPDFESFRPWSLHREDYNDLPWPPGSGPTGLEPYSRSQLLEYRCSIDDMIDSAVDALDLSASDCGMPWHQGMPKLDHQLHNLRHIQHHTALLAGRLRTAGGIEVQWVRPKN